MNEIKAVHRRAMDLLDEADMAAHRQDAETAEKFRREAYALERSAADMTATSDLEPTRSILHRSAASLALALGDNRGAELLIYRALMGNPPPEILTELQDMAEGLTFSRHLKVRGIELTNDEFQVSISGAGIGFGLAPIDEVLDRIGTAKLLLIRTAERVLGRPYRAAGRQSRVVQDLVMPMLSIPRAASYAISFRIGRTDQLAFEGLGARERVVDELLECLELFSEQDSKSLQERIKDVDYYRSFVALSTAISPDGTIVNLVGFSANRGGESREVAIRTDRAVGEQMLLEAPPSEGRPLKNRKTKPIVISGLLRFADAINEKSSIKLKAGKKTYNVFVPSGIDDIVRPLWGSWVTISGEHAGKNIELRTIRATDPPSDVG